MSENAVALPRVTGILQAIGLGPDYSGIGSAVLYRAAARGTALHAAIELHHLGELDEETVHPEIRPGFDAYLAFCRDTGHVPIASEMELIHPQWAYMGHPDRVGWQGAERALLDWKYVWSLDEDYVRLQLAGYKLAWNAVHPESPVSRCFALHLRRRDSTYRFVDLTDPLAEQEFLAALVVYRNLERRGRLEKR